MTFLPHFAKGEVIRGFGRGSKELGIPTANFPEETINGLPQNMPLGVYSGFAKVEDDDAVYKMVMSVGWNPFYKNEKKSMETHIMHKFDRELYGKQLSVVMVTYLREEKNFPSLEALVEAINKDIADAEAALTQEVLEKHLHYFKS